MPSDDDANLHPNYYDPEVLAAAITEVAQINGIETGEVIVGPMGGVRMLRGRDSMSVSSRSKNGPFGMSINRYNNSLAGGVAEDLVQVARVAEFWRRGATVKELHAQFPFIVYDALGEAYEVEDPATFRWKQLFETEDYKAIHPVSRAAYEHPRLRPLVATVSHHTLLRLEVDYRDEYAEVILILTKATNLYHVWSSTVQTRVVVKSIDEAISAAVSLLP